MLCGGGHASMRRIDAGHKAQSVGGPQRLPIRQRQPTTRTDRGKCATAQQVGPVSPAHASPVRRYAPPGQGRMVHEKTTAESGAVSVCTSSAPHFHLFHPPDSAASARPPVPRRRRLSRRPVCGSREPLLPTRYSLGSCSLWQRLILVQLSG